MRCIFCRRTAIGQWTLTVCSGDPELVGSWRREVAPVCPRCGRLLDGAGREGSVFKVTGERWFAGHGVGRFRALGQREYL